MRVRFLLVSATQEAWPSAPLFAGDLLLGARSNLQHGQLWPGTVYWYGLACLQRPQIRRFPFEVVVNIG
jgi:hypothetical protein